MPRTQKIVLNIGGMTCVACAKAVERSVQKVKGVSSAVVSFASEKLTVSYDADTATPENIKTSVAKAGYSASPERPPDETPRLKKQCFLTAAFCVPLFTIAMSGMFTQGHHKEAAFAEFILCTAIMFFGRRFFTVGFKSLLNLSPNMDSLIAIGTSAAYLYSLFEIVSKHALHNLYFESAGVIITLISTGRYIEARAKRRTGDAVKNLLDLSPKEATVVRDGRETVIDAALVAVGDIIIAKPGSTFPADGIVLEGETSVDESMLTGESLPVEKRAGDRLTGGSLNRFGTVRYRAEKVGKDTVLAKIAELVENAQNSKAPIARLADTVSGYFVPTVTALAFLSAALWLISGESFPFAVKIFISVLIIACPCALGLATPMSVMVAAGLGARFGILFKSGAAIETTHKIQVAFLDKTGTVTEGKPHITDVIPAPGFSKEAVLKLAAACEKGSEHPLGAAIAEAFSQKGELLPSVVGFTALSGYGVRGTVDAITVLVGNRKLMAENGIDSAGIDSLTADLKNSGKTFVYAAADGKLAGVLAAADTVKPTSPNAVERLKALGVEPVMLTGDNRYAAAAAAAAGIAEYKAELLPADKSREIRELRETGKAVCMAGDGINDAPALAEADIGITLAAGTDAAINSADIVLMKNDLSDVATAVELSRKTFRNIKQNLFWAFAYNTIGIPVAMGVLHVFGGPVLNPMIASLAMSFSSVSVVLNSLRLRNFTPAA
jgi:Cu+-exporting ATPase